MEQKEIILTIEKLLELYDLKFKDKKEVSLADSLEMKQNGISMEMFLNFMAKKYEYLFHGSRIDIGVDEEISSKSRGEIYASSEPVIAIMKSIYLNNVRNLAYPFFLKEGNSNLVLTIEGIQEDTIGETGFVYLVERSDFVEDSNSNWQYSKKVKDGEGIRIVKKIQIEKDDFKYPVEIID